MSDNIYQSARLAAGLTQERAAELLTISVESIRMYETGRRIPPDYIVSRMSDLYNSQFLIIQHVRQADDLARQLLPEVRERPLAQTAIRLYREFRDFGARNRVDELIRIAEDGVIDAEERPRFDAIVTELNEIVAAAYELRLNEF